MRKISTKIMLSIMVCSIIVSVLLGTLSIIKSSSYIKKEANEKLEFKAAAEAGIFNDQIRQVESGVHTLKLAVINTFDLRKVNNDIIYVKEEYHKEVGSLLSDFVKTTPVQGVYLTFNPELLGNKAYEIWYADEKLDGNVVWVDSDPDDDLIEWFEDEEEMEYYYAPIEANKGIWLSVSEDIVLGIDVVTYSVPIYKNDILIGTLGIDISIEDIKDKIKKMELYETGYGFLMDMDYDYIYHPKYVGEDETYGLRNDKDGDLTFVIDEMDKNNKGYIELNLNGVEKVLAYSKLYNGWTVAVEVPKSEILKPIGQHIRHNGSNKFTCIKCFNRSC
ncbi:PDC sensor domain-containing protein [Anaeromicrobium sp.]|uniref:PDC sensor domain-containing protein n=1 Tax=Anaeromicrobium sp. TaxID=1929132 RepID=UPI0025CE1162|nr:cache domain-containing protein [Anaeromicrobium sp.]